MEPLHTVRELFFGDGIEFSYSVHAPTCVPADYFSADVHACSIAFIRDQLLLGWVGGVGWGVGVGWMGGL